MVPKEAPLIVLDSKSAMCMAKNGKDTKHTRNIARIIHFVRNGEKCKMQKIDWCEGGLQLEDIGTNNISEPDLTPSLTIIYFILGVGSGSHTLLVLISTNCRPPSYQSIFCILHFSLFITQCIILAMCLVCLVSLPFLAMHIVDLLSKTIKGASSGTMSGFLFSSS